MKSTFLIFIAFLFGIQLNAKTEKLVWPREIEVPGYVITLYQPQLETFDQNILTGRMALSVKKEKEDLVFGALWFDAKLLTEKENRTATLVDLDIPMVKFPDVED